MTPIRPLYLFFPFFLCFRWSSDGVKIIFVYVLQVFTNLLEHDYTKSGSCARLLDRKENCFVFSSNGSIILISMLLFEPEL